MRHASDAGFYWAQHDQSVHSPKVGLERLLHFGRVLDAHLDGLLVAGDEGWQIAIEELERWRSSREVFVAAYLALRSDNGDRLRAVWDVIKLSPERGLRGLISALAWVPAKHSLPWIEHWAQGNQPALQVTALRAAALMGAAADAAIATAVEPALRQEDSSVRAAACRLIGTGRFSPPPAALEDWLNHADLCTRAEAAIALLPHKPEAAVNSLWKAVGEQAGLAADAEGWDKQQAERRLARWVRLLGPYLPYSHPAIPQLVSRLPVRQGLQLALYHADPALLPWIIDQMESPDTARYAGWVWYALTGVHLERYGLAVPPDADDERITLADSDLDAGLPLPHLPSIRAWQSMHGSALPAGSPVLLGQALNTDLAISTLALAPQALRTIASQWLAREAAPYRALSTRSPAARQAVWLAKLPHSHCDEWVISRL